MIKFRLLFDKDKETAWLNELSMQGKAMTGFFAGFYRFEDTTPGKWSYQVDFSDRFGAVTESYRAFMNEMSIEIVQIWGYWVILRKHAADGPFELYTDTDSKISHYKKIRTMFRICSIAELACFLIETLCAVGQGITIGWVGMLIVGLFTIVLMRQTIRTNDIITTLMEEKGEKNTYKICKKQNVSPILLTGLLLNVCALSINADTATEFMHTIKLIIQIVAIIAMLVGIYQTRWLFTDKKD